MSSPLRPEAAPALDAWLRCWLRDAVELSDELHDEVTPALAVMRLSLGALPESAERSALGEALSMLERWLVKRRGKNVLPIVRKLGLRDALEWMIGRAEQRSGAVLAFRSQLDADFELTEGHIAALGATAELLDAWVTEARHHGTLTLRSDGASLCIELAVAAELAREGTNEPRDDAWRKLLRSLGGDLHVEASAEGRRLDATLRLPLPPRHELAPCRASHEALDRPRYRVLVVDDEPVIGRVLERLLTRHEVDYEPQADTALARLRAGELFDVILCDLVMPRVSGTELWRALRCEHPELAERVVFMTGGTYQEDLEAFLASVPNPRCIKPFSLSAVERVIEEVAGQRRDTSP